MNDWNDFEHTGPGTLAGRYLRSFWQPVHHSADLPAGRAIPIRIMSEDFTVYRGHSGAPHVVGFRCAHRAMQLSVGQVEGDALRCFYHGWKYDASGQCVEQPGEPRPFCHKVRIPNYPTREYLGLIFAYLGEGAPPEFPRYPSFEDPEALIHHDSYVRSVNYFVNLENNLDPTHVAFAHSTDPMAYDWRVECPTLWTEESEWGLTYRLDRPNGKVVTGQFGMPNKLYIQGLPLDPEAGGREFITHFVPIDDERHAYFSAVIVRRPKDVLERYMQRRAERLARRDLDREAVARAILAGKLDYFGDVDRERVDMVRLGDDLVQMGQGPAERRRDAERLGHTDAAIILGRKLWARELRALAEGRPLRAWRFDPERIQAPATY